jgi:hypothetical protein
MPRPSSITPELLDEVAARRRAGEAWKLIAADLRARGLPFDRATYWRAGIVGVAQHRDACEAAPA